MTKTATCGGCDTRWLQHGNITGHCAERGCHRTFTGIKAFDRHQSISSEGRNVLPVDGRWRGGRVAAGIHCRRHAAARRPDGQISGGVPTNERRTRQDRLSGP